MDHSVSSHFKNKSIVKCFVIHTHDTMYDMEVDADAQCKHVLTACQDRNIRVYTVGSGKHSRSVSQSSG